MPTLAPPLALRLSAYVLLGCFVAVGIGTLHHTPSTADDPAYDAIVTAHHRRVVADSVALVEAHTALAAATARVTRARMVYHAARDTLNIHDTVQVRVFVQRADSVERSCAGLQTPVLTFRSACDSAQASLTVDRDFWKGRFEQARPGRWDRVWGAIRLPLAFVGGVYIGSRVAR